jgi:predicted metalloprotease
LLALAVAVAGCGSTAHDSPTTTQATSTQTTANATTQGAGTATGLGGQVGEDLGRFAPVPAVATAHLPAPPTSPTVERAFLIAVFDDVQSVWRREFAAAHVRYTPARLVIFYNKTRSDCGPHDGSGPFYCPGDRGVYLDLRFFNLMLRDKAVGAAAQAYIIGHEIGHHVQRMIGIADHIDAANKADPNGAKQRGVRSELEADCLAGVWARSAYPRSDLTQRDLDEGLTAAHVIGDDYIALSGGNVVDPSLFTHGSSADRRSWLTVGYRSGRPTDCNTFAKP